MDQLETLTTTGGAAADLTASVLAALQELNTSPDLRSGLVRVAAILHGLLRHDIFCVLPHLLDEGPRGRPDGVVLKVVERASRRRIAFEGKPRYDPRRGSPRSQGGKHGRTTEGWTGLARSRRVDL